MHDHCRVSARSLGLAALLNALLAAVEFAVRFQWVNSATLVSAAIHDFGDFIWLGVSYLLLKSGSAKAERWASLFNAVVLIAGSLWVLSEASLRLIRPEALQVENLTGVAVLGLAINSFAFWLLHRGQSASGHFAKWHFFEDFGGCLALLALANLPLSLRSSRLDSAIAICLYGFVLVMVIRRLVRMEKADRR